MANSPHWLLLVNLLHSLAVLVLLVLSPMPPPTVDDTVDWQGTFVPCVVRHNLRCTRAKRWELFHELLSVNITILYAYSPHSFVLRELRGTLLRRLMPRLLV